MNTDGEFKGLYSLSRGPGVDYFPGPVLMALGAAEYILASGRCQHTLDSAQSHPEGFEGMNKKSLSQW